MTRVLPPKALLMAVLSQIPLALGAWPLHPSPIEIAGGVLLLSLGATLNIWADRLFHRHDVGVCPFTRVPVLIVEGPYRVTRNPMYVGLVCLNLGVTLVTGVLANAWSSIAYAIWLHYAFVLPEEVFLKTQVGEAGFAAYAARSTRWIGWTMRRSQGQEPLEPSGTSY